MRFSRFLRDLLSWRPSRDQNGTSEISDEDSDQDEHNHLPEVDPWHRYFLLSLDGGGIRGLSTLYILEELMNKIGECERQYDPNATHSFYPDPFIAPRGSATPDDPGYAYRYFPCHYFDGIFGASTGGLIGIMLGRLRMNIKDCIEEYKRFGGEIFGHPRRAHIRGKKRYFKFNPLKDKHHVAPLRNAINRIVSNRDPFTHDSQNPARVGKAILELPRGLCQTAVCTVEGSSSREGWLFRSYPFPRTESFLQRDQRTSQYKIELVACATTAAPTYFKPTKHEDLVFYDGGLTANNPTQLAIQEVCDYVNGKHGPGADDDGHLGAAVSIGTGKVARQKLKPPKSWLGRYGEAVGWEQRRADNSSSIHREMVRFTQKTNEHLKTKGVVDGSPLQFKYFRFTVGRNREQPEDHEIVVPEDSFGDVDKMANLPMDEWIPEPNPNATVVKIRQATRAWLSSPTIQEELKDLAKVLVINRRKRAECDKLTTLQRQTSSPRAVRWYRYASASEWVCRYHNCSLPFYTQSAVQEHVELEHKVSWEESRARRTFCNYEEPGCI